MNVRKHCVGGKMGEGRIEERRGGGDGGVEVRKGEVEGRMKGEEGGRR